MEGGIRREREEEDKKRNEGREEKEERKMRWEGKEWKGGLKEREEETKKRTGGRREKKGNRRGEREGKKAHSPTPVSHVMAAPPWG